MSQQNSCKNTYVLGAVYSPSLQITLTGFLFWQWEVSSGILGTSDDLGFFPRRSCLRPGGSRLSLRVSEDRPLGTEGCVLYFCFSSLSHCFWSQPNSLFTSTGNTTNPSFHSQPFRKPYVVFWQPTPCFQGELDPLFHGVSFRLIWGVWKNPFKEVWWIRTK